MVKKMEGLLFGEPNITEKLSESGEMVLLIPESQILHLPMISFALLHSSNFSNTP